MKIFEHITARVSLPDAVNTDGESGTVDSQWSPQEEVTAFFHTKSQERWIEFKRHTSTTDQSTSGQDGQPGDVLVTANLMEGTQYFRVGPCQQLWLIPQPPPLATSTAGEKSPMHASLSLHFRSSDESNDFFSAVDSWKGSSSAETGGGSVFDQKIEASSAKMYFHYYGQLLHQQNMLQDYVRTGTYYAAVLENRVDFEGKVVMDVGAGSGILSLFAAQAGAARVYAVEASPMAECAKRLAQGNPDYGDRVTVLHGKVEEVEIPEKVDVLISEPMGILLVNERMLESYIIARDRFLKPGGKMFPALGRIHLAPFSDEYLYSEISGKALFWQQSNYYGVDLTALQQEALGGYFTQPVVDAFDPRLLVAPGVTHTIDFGSATEEDLFEIDIPLSFTTSAPTRVHGLACWFDVLFAGSTLPRWLSTSPGAPTTHWYQLRCVLQQPLYVLPGQQITGRFTMKAHKAQSYSLHLSMQQGGQKASEGVLELKDPYYRMGGAVAWAGSEGTGNGNGGLSQPVATESMSDLQQPIANGQQGGDVAASQPASQAGQWDRWRESSLL